MSTPLPFKILLLSSKDTRAAIEARREDFPAHHFYFASEVEAAVSLLRTEMPHVVLLDFASLHFEPLAFYRQAQAEQSTAKFLGLGASGSLRLALNAMKAGFHEVFDSATETAKLAKELHQLAAQWEERQRGEAFHQTEKTHFDFSKIIGASAAMQQVWAMIGKVAGRKRVTVLLRGETGTGKELIARTIHYNSSEQFQPFVEINCGAIPENLLESEIFGYEKGAFTDAKTRKRGLFEMAENGTLFLDEIGEISPMVQVKLLKAIEEKKIRRLGGTEDIAINARIIAATNRDLQAAIRDGQFRQDLYYRLNVVTLHLPPLREREEDVLVLARHFLARFAQEYESPKLGFTPEAEALLRTYDWPGNVRELQNTIERIVLLTEGEWITHAALAQAVASETPLLMAINSQTTTVQIEIPPEGMSLEEGEQKLIAAVLHEVGWNKRRACRALKISRPRLDRKIEKYKLAPLLKNASRENGNESLPSQRDEHRPRG